MNTPINDRFEEFWKDLSRENPDLNDVAKDNIRGVWFSAFGSVLDVLFSPMQDSDSIIPAMAKEYMREVSGISDSPLVICNPSNDGVH